MNKTLSYYTCGFAGGLDVYHFLDKKLTFGIVTFTTILSLLIVKKIF